MNKALGVSLGKACQEHLCFALYKLRRRTVRSRALPPHRISPRHPARLLRLPLKGGVILALQTANIVYTLDREHDLHSTQAVSYTHLTLPTKRIV